jgi:hypothetical protein
MLNVLFTIGGPGSYPCAMFVLALAAATLAAPAPQPTLRPVLQQATATVRIIAGERISATDLPRDAMIRDTEVKGADGGAQKVRLVEFP